MKSFVFVLFCALLPRIVAGQCTSSQERPAWVNGYFFEEAKSYIEVVSADGYDEENARNKAAAIAIERRSLSTGKRVQVTVQNGMVRIEGNDELTVKTRIIDEYREHCGAGQYRVYLLVQTAKNPTFDFEPVKVTNDYTFSPRVFVPGMAQLQKGSKAKGLFFILGETAFVGGIVIAESLRASYESKIGSTHNASDRTTYINNADNMQNLRNGFIAGAATLYLWNVIDGVVAKGKKHVVIGTAELHVTPYLTPSSSGVALALRF